MSKIIIAVMLLLVPPSWQKHREETESDARARYETIAQAIAEEAGEDRNLAAFLLAVAKHESTYARDVHEGKRKGDVGRSYGLFQHKMPNRDPYVRIPGHPKKWRARDIVGVDPESTRRAVWTAAWVLRPHVERCRSNPRCVFMSYGGVSAETVERDADVRKRIEARVKTYTRARASLR